MYDAAEAPGAVSSGPPLSDDPTADEVLRRLCWCANRAIADKLGQPDNPRPLLWAAPTHRRAVTEWSEAGVPVAFVESVLRREIAAMRWPDGRSPQSLSYWRAQVLDAWAAHAGPTLTAGNPTTDAVQSPDAALHTRTQSRLDRLAAGPLRSTLATTSGVTHHGK